MKSRAPQLHLEYRFYKQLGQAGKFEGGLKGLIAIHLPNTVRWARWNDFDQTAIVMKSEVKITKGTIEGDFKCTCARTLW